jgi:competence protein ComEC
MGIPAANVYEDGMQTAVFREKWELKGKGLWR